MDTPRDRCIQATIQLCSSQGRDFTMSQLAASLGMSKKTLYVLFPSKEALLLEMVDAMFCQVKESETALLADSTLPLAQKVRRLVVVLPESFKALNRSRLQGVEQRYPAVYRRIRLHLESGWEPTLALLWQGMEAGVFRPFSLGVFRSMVEGSIEYFLASGALQREGLDYVQALDQMMELLLEGILAKQEEQP